MARAYRHFIPGYNWHITHRCHKRDFLLKFAKDRTRWMELLFEAKMKFRLSILNFIITSNHIHLILSSSENPQAIPGAMQLIAGRTAQEYNRRKKRKGAFWQDRYHATAIESGKHLWRCLVYVDLNMVRAGVVNHPSEWKWSGYHEIQHPKDRYRLIDHRALKRLLNVDSHERLATAHLDWISSQLIEKPQRQKHFVESIAVGGEPFIKKLQTALGIKSIGKKKRRLRSDEYHLRETIEKYGNEDRIPQHKDELKEPWDNTIPLVL
ncbi:transposase [Desulfosarcina ovata]|uniref:transposase n=1 Tax=Desulfosarcina ovata TaxID=83564 RepID=UPI0018D5B92C|nr:transposase [Desulfosarcina ovata]